MSRFKAGVLVASSLLLSHALASEWPLTRAERTNFNETSHYSDVVTFLKDLQKMGAPVSIQMIGTSHEGRDIPMAIASYPPVSTPAEAQRLGKPIIYIQANIHAGEVEGKEAAQIVLRRLCQAGPKGLLSKVILIVVPIYNIDGNEKFGPVAVNRPEQDGPPMVGVRPNGQGFDLNRDAIKSESPENSALLANVYNAWNPDVMMDLHTTDGTRHGWELTYAPPQNPNTEATIAKFSRDTLIGHVRREIQSKYGLPLFDYGNTERFGKQTVWATFGMEGRYCTNYVGLRNRIGILSEATTYIPFKARVEVTDKFVTSTIQYVADKAKQVVALTRSADATVVAWGQNPATAPPMGVRFDLDQRGPDTVLLEKPRAKGEKYDIASRPTEIIKEKMPIYDRFKITKTSKYPAAYFIPASESKTIELLKRHGVIVEKLAETWSGNVEKFSINKVTTARSAFQGHKLITLDGTFTQGSATAAEGTYVVRMAQPLGVLAFHILEPESQDGATAWGFLGEKFEAGQTYPILKSYDQVKAALVR